jgi:hypothetical protein
MAHKLHELPISQHDAWREAIRLKPASYLVQLQPHSVEAGDAYYIGDAYDDQLTVAREWDIKDG